MKKTKIRQTTVLDSTLRYLYHTISFRTGCKLMAIEFKHNGRLWRADTVDEAIELRRRLESTESMADIMGDEPQFPKEVTWRHDEVTEVLKGIGQQQERFMLMLADGKEVGSEAVVKELGLDSEVALAGVLSGLSKQVRKMNFDVQDVYSVRVQWSGKEKKRFFKIGWQFRLAAVEVGWPDQWK